MVDAAELHPAMDRSGDYCDDCIESCPICDNNFYWDIDDHYRWCDYCGRRICTEYDFYVHCDDCYEYFCEDCNCDCGMSDSGQVHGYYWNPPEFIKHGDRGAAHFGIELEIGGYESDIVAAVNEIDGMEEYIYMKEDGTVDGVEIISMPMTLEFHQSFGWDELLAELRRRGCRTEDEYGMHIHIDRRAFRHPGTGRHSHTHAYRWMKFTYRNAEWVRVVSRRSSFWGEFRHLGRGDMRRKSSAYPTSDERRSAINTTKGGTYELRTGRSTLSYRKFLALVEFAAASVEYTRQRNIPMVEMMRWENFMAWCVDQGDAYANLVALVATAAGGAE